MTLFALTYLAIYGGMTFYVLQRLWRGLGGPARIWLPLGGLALLLMLVPILLHRLEGRLGETSARLVAGVGWTWLALVFWACMAFLATELWNVGAAVVAHARGSLPSAVLWPRGAALAVLVLLPLLCAWGWVEAGLVGLRTVVVESDRLPPAMRPLRLLQVSDMHLGRTSRPAVWRRVLAAIRAAEPDVLVSTGDFVDASDRFVDPWVRELNSIQPPLGKYAVLGNHEFYPGVRRTMHFLTAGGFTILRGEAIGLGPDVRLVGVDDPTARQMGGVMGLDEADLLAPRSRAPFTILLKHRPAVSAAARQGSDLQLSGHTHGGQIFPFGLFVRLLHPYRHAALIPFPEGLRLYVSRGTGTWGPPFRFLAPPEVTLFILRPPRP